MLRRYIPTTSKTASVAKDRQDIYVSGKGKGEKFLGFCWHPCSQVWFFLVSSCISYLRFSEIFLFLHNETALHCFNGISISSNQLLYFLDIELCWTSMVAQTVKNLPAMLETQVQSLKKGYASLSQFSSVAQSCPTLWDPMNHSTPGLPVHHQRPEFTQTHAHQVSDAIQPSHPLLSPSPLAPNPSQHQSLFQWVNSSHEVPKVLEFQL